MAEALIPHSAHGATVYTESCQNDPERRHITKKIVLACGSGVATSSAVAKKVSELLDANGYEGAYTIVQCAIAEAASQCADADLLVATTVAPAGITCDYVSGIPFLTGMGKADAEHQILEVMAK